jgi:mercuric ion transport protein
MQALRYLFLAVAVLFVAGIAYQVFLAGMAVFGAGHWSNHVDFGYFVAMIPALMILTAWLARAGRPTVWLTAITLVAASVQTFLPLFRDDVPWISALHPVNAMVIFGLGVVVARRAWVLARSAAPVTERGTEPARQNA